MADGSLTRLALAVVLLALVSVGWWLVARRRGVQRPSNATLSLGELGDVQAGRRLTLVQFSAQVCASCKRSREAWQALADEHEDIAFTELSAEDHLDLLTRLNVLTTPTTAVFNGSGDLDGLITGPPSPAQLKAFHLGQNLTLEPS